MRRYLRALFAFGFFDRAAYRNDDGQIDQQGHAAAAQQIEESGITLLKNGSHVLPLDPAKLKSIALIGPQADRFENGGGADDVTPFVYTTPRQAITQRAGPKVSVTHDDGSDAAQAAAVARSAEKGAPRGLGRVSGKRGARLVEGFEDGSVAALDRDALGGERTASVGSAEWTVRRSLLVQAGRDDYVVEDSPA